MLFSKDSFNGHVDRPIAWMHMENYVRKDVDLETCATGWLQPCRNGASCHEGQPPAPSSAVYTHPYAHTQKWWMYRASCRPLANLPLSRAPPQPPPTTARRTKVMVPGTELPTSCPLPTQTYLCYFIGRGGDLSPKISHCLNKLSRFKHMGRASNQDRSWSLKDQRQELSPKEIHLQSMPSYLQKSDWNEEVRKKKKNAYDTSLLCYEKI